MLLKKVFEAFIPWLFNFGGGGSTGGGGGSSTPEQPEQIKTYQTAALKRMDERVLDLYKNHNPFLRNWKDLVHGDDTYLLIDAYNPKEPLRQTEAEYAEFHESLKQWNTRDNWESAYFRADRTTKKYLDQAADVIEKHHQFLQGIQTVGNWNEYRAAAKDKMGGELADNESRAKEFTAAAMAMSAIQNLKDGMTLGNEQLGARIAPAFERRLKNESIVDDLSQTRDWKAMFALGDSQIEQVLSPLQDRFASHDSLVKSILAKPSWESAFEAAKAALEGDFADVEARVKAHIEGILSLDPDGDWRGFADTAREKADELFPGGGTPEFNEKVAAFEERQNAGLQRAIGRFAASMAEMGADNTLGFAMGIAFLQQDHQRATAAHQADLAFQLERERAGFITAGIGQMAQMQERKTLAESAATNIYAQFFQGKLSQVNQAVSEILALLKTKVEADLASTNVLQQQRWTRVNFIYQAVGAVADLLKTRLSASGDSVGHAQSENLGYIKSLLEFAGQLTRNQEQKLATQLQAMDAALNVKRTKLDTVAQNTTLMAQMLNNRMLGHASFTEAAASFNVNRAQQLTSSAAEMSRVMMQRLDMKRASAHLMAEMSRMLILAKTEYNERQVDRKTKASVWGYDLEQHIGNMLASGGGGVAMPHSQSGGGGGIMSSLGTALSFAAIATQVAPAMAAL